MKTPHLKHTRTLVEMRPLASLLVVFLAIACCACGKGDRVVAEVNHHKLYLSEVREQLPDGLSLEDSALLGQQIVDDWTTEQLILAEAEKALSIKEKNFDKEVAAYKRMLMKQRFFEKITADEQNFKVSDEEVSKVIRQSKGNRVVDKEIVKFNYVKLSKDSKLKDDIKGILFDEARRVTEKSEIERLCSDTIEYFIEDSKWLFWDDIQLEANIDFNGRSTADFPLCIEKTEGPDCYLIVILDYKSEQSSEDDRSYFESVRTMLIQQKKTNYINQYIQKLKEKSKL